MAKQSGQKAAYAVGEHLPRRPRPLPEEKVADKAADRAGQKARLRAKGNAGDHNDRGHGLEVGNGRESRPAGYRQRGEHCQHHQLTGLGAAGFKHQKEGAQGECDDEQTGEIPDLAAQSGTKNERRRDEQEEQDQSQPAPAGECCLFHSPFLLHSSATSSAVTALRKIWRLIRLAAVV